MAEVFSGKHIYRDVTNPDRPVERVVPTAILWDNVVRLCSHKNVGVVQVFENKEPKTAFKMRNGDTLWFLIPYSEACRQWGRYHGDQPEPAKPAARPTTVDSQEFPQPSDN